ncbi:MAG: septum formation initiator family protein [Candidatus Methylacidiphilales bacterium]|nr:septum formation initiator family protein [Candidatus Methylacidiphilales bacterium]
MGARSKFFDPRSIRASTRPSTGDLWGRLVPWFYFAIILGLLTLAGVIFWPQILKTQQAQARKIALLGEIESEQARTLKLQQVLYALRDDRFYVERMARDVLNYGKEGETIFKFPPYGGEANPLRQDSPQP